MRLIDADALRDEVLYDNTYDSHTVNYYLDVIDDAPTIDAVQVVRCADCKHSCTPVRDETGGISFLYCFHLLNDEEYNALRVDFTDYCSRGESKEVMP